MSSKDAKPRGKVTKVNKTLGDKQAKTKKRSRSKTSGIHPEGEFSSIWQAFRSRIQLPANDDMGEDGSGDGGHGAEEEAVEDWDMEGPEANDGGWDNGAGEKGTCDGSGW
jgi:hypothetical protein